MISSRFSISRSSRLGVLLFYKAARQSQTLTIYRYRHTARPARGSEIPPPEATWSLWPCASTDSPWSLCRCGRYGRRFISSFFILSAFGRYHGGDWAWRDEPRNHESMGFWSVGGGTMRGLWDMDGYMAVIVKRVATTYVLCVRARPLVSMNKSSSFGGWLAWMIGGGRELYGRVYACGQNKGKGVDG